MPSDRPLRVWRRRRSIKFAASAYGNVGILLRMLGALQTIASLTANPVRRRALHEQVEVIAELGSIAPSSPRTNGHGLKAGWRVCARRSKWSRFFSPDPKKENLHRLHATV